MSSEIWTFGKQQIRRILPLIERWLRAETETLPEKLEKKKKEKERGRDGRKEAGGRSMPSSSCRFPRENVEYVAKVSVDGR